MFHLYGLIVGIALVAGWSVAERIDRRVVPVLPMVIVFTLLGARLYHVVDLWPYYIHHLGEMTMIWKGGLGIFGGIVGGVIGLRLRVKSTREFWEILAAIVVGLPLAQAIGRWGNFANNELWGIHHAPLFLYESILDIMLFGLIWRIRHIRHIRDTQIVGSYCLGYGLVRLLLEPMKINPWWFGYVMAVSMVVLGLTLWYKSHTPIKK